MEPRGPPASAGSATGGRSARRGSRWRARDGRSGGRSGGGCVGRDGRGVRPRPGAAGAGIERVRDLARGAVPRLPGAGRGALAGGGGRGRASGDDHAGAPQDHPARGSRQGRAMSQRVRYAVFGTGALGLAVLLVWGLAGLPDFGDFAGRYGHVLAHSAVPQRKATSSISVTTFDYRGVDTLIEEFILFTAAVGVVALLRTGRERDDVAAEPESVRRPTAQSGSLGSVATALVGPGLVLGINVVLHGHLTPGGGF